ncbi:response regulator transcription factor [Clostridiaceae bacterium NSJ-31]|uniref:Stage 0 sporulation protein A homolog n=1 Tax=Ligaoa zhengdingensis TaxID=2763658 RepID=A0A926DYD2_9FIRM|nr:response regulator transcription factor [Ligaoa zhengdingensis]MBC8547525.1 response regulator transcription factor [Ligaoa zhengdingensis]
MDNKILIAEDEANIRRVVAGTLTKAGFSVVEACDGQDALEKFDEHPDIILVVLDVMMPKLNGYEVCERLRARSQVPILMLTALDGEADEVTGLTRGADDYVSKPFSSSVLVARIQTLLRRTAVGSKENLELGGIVLRYRERLVTVNGERVLMTPKEFDLLYYLMQNKNLVLTRDQILSTVWNADYFGDDRTVDTHIKCLRAKLGECGRYIVTLRKVGYKFECEV